MEGRSFCHEERPQNNAIVLIIHAIISIGDVLLWLE